MQSFNTWSLFPLLRLVITFVVATMLASCAGGGGTMPSSTHTYAEGTSTMSLTTADAMSGGPCSVSVDGQIWYALPLGAIPAIDFTHVKCAAAATLAADAQPPIPAWAHPTSPTQAIFVATTLQETYSPQGMLDLEGLASGAGVPMTWMIGNESYLANEADLYNQYHASNGDDVELEPAVSLYASAEQSLPWYAPAVTVAGAGMQRNVAAARQFGDGAFWGLTWNSHGTDGTSDEGAPWGSFCADVSSYKRPSPAGDCSLISFEWTARDLTRAYLADTDSKGYSAEAAFSTDPEDIVLRGGFTSTTGATYLRELVDAYAAGGVDRPIVMMSQQESADEGTNATRDDPMMDAMYREAVSVGMKPMTLRSAAAIAAQFSAQPRAIAFPFIPGGNETSYNGAPFAPATIDYHDNVAGMTFLAGHTLPSRIFTYALDPTSATTVPLAQIVPSSESYPTLQSVTASGGVLTFVFDAPSAMEFGIALWSDPATLMLSGSNVTTAGRAGAVVTFALPSGVSTQTVRCAGCVSTTFAYAI